MPQPATLIHSLKLAGMRVLEAAPDAEVIIGPDGAISASGVRPLCPD